MSDNRKQLKHHLDEIERLNKRLPELNETARTAVSVWEVTRVNRASYPHAEADAVSSVKTAIEDHAQQVKKLRGLVEWEDGLKGAAATMKAARKTMESAQTDLNGLQEKQRAITGKMENIQAKSLQDLRVAEVNQSAAVQAYAEAVTTGEGDGERRAQDALQRTAGALEDCRRGHSDSESVAHALAREVDKVGEAIEDAMQRLNEARRELLMAARYLWADKLEHASRELARIAAHISAADRALGWQSSMDDIHLPLLAPTGPRYLDKRYMQEVGAGLGIEQLTAA
ncbi:MAG: hypothetical protein K2X80_19555 [Pseudomonadaceae bacterium]|nr:hypothetical protein [Pseudomonadaceae bacterium]